MTVGQRATTGIAFIRFLEFDASCVRKGKRQRDRALDRRREKRLVGGMILLEERQSRGGEEEDVP